MFSKQARTAFYLGAIVLLIWYSSYWLVSDVTLTPETLNRIPSLTVGQQEFDSPPPPSTENHLTSEPTAVLNDPRHKATTAALPTNEITGRPYSAALARQFNVTSEAMQDAGLWRELVRYRSSSPPAPNVNVLLASWRTGSTFIGKMLAAHPGSFYHYEPMHRLGLHQARDGALLDQAATEMQQLAHCNISEQYITASRKLKYGLKHDTPWNRQCAGPVIRRNATHWCWDCHFLRDLCQMQPYRLVKSVRVRLPALRLLLEDSPNARVVVLGRDPRATKHSRRNPLFCHGREPLCDDPGLCGDMVQDYHTAVSYETLFPGRVRLMRYEDLIKEPMEQFQNLTNFYSLKFTVRMQEKIKESMNGTAVIPKTSANTPNRPEISRTPPKSGGPKGAASLYRTVRDSKFEVQQWRLELPWQEVVKIQDECEEAMRLWGYNSAPSEDQLPTFQPVGAFTSSIKL